MIVVAAEERQADDQHLGAAHGRSEAVLAAAVAQLDRLDGAALRRRWRSLVGSPLPADLGRALTVRVLAYRLQAQHLGDLDKASTRELSAMIERTATIFDVGSAVPPGSSASGRRSAAEPALSVVPRPLARPGTVLVREYAGVRHRVIVLDDGIAWDGKTYDSLSQVAFAITGTRWNGPRFFGLREKAGKDDKHAPVDPLDRTAGQGARSSRRAPLARQAPSSIPARP